jgi:hypothetical protein
MIVVERWKTPFSFSSKLNRRRMLGYSHSSDLHYGLVILHVLLLALLSLPLSLSICVQLKLTALDETNYQHRAAKHKIQHTHTEMLKMLPLSCNIIASKLHFHFAVPMCRISQGSHKQEWETFSPFILCLLMKRKEENERQVEKVDLAFLSISLPASPSFACSALCLIIYVNL